MPKNAFRDRKISEIKWLVSVGNRFLDDMALNCDGIDLIGRSASYPLLDNIKMIWLESGGVTETISDSAYRNVSITVLLWLSKLPSRSR